MRGQQRFWRYWEKQLPWLLMVGCHAVWTLIRGHQLNGAWQASATKMTLQMLWGMATPCYCLQLWHSRHEVVPMGTGMIPSCGHVPHACGTCWHPCATTDAQVSAVSPNLQGDPLPLELRPLCCLSNSVPPYPLVTVAPICLCSPSLCHHINCVLHVPHCQYP